MGLEFLRFQQGVDEVGEQQKCCYSADDVIHKVAPSVALPRLEAITGFGEGPTPHEKPQSNDDVEQVK